MATVTHDGQSLLVESRRFWIVSGGIDYFRVPRALWAERIRAAAGAGLNTILVRCPWSLHEPRKGEYCFEEEADVAAFVRLIADHGLKCILRPGPYIGGELDLGGMPSWLLAEKDLLVRQGTAPFLEAASRYLGKLLKVLSPHSGRVGGPIILVQVEHEWHCGHQEAADAYLHEIARFIREHDFDLPLINTNNLWQRREETIDTWCGRENMLMNLRQLRAIQPGRPLIVGDFWVGHSDCWSRPHDPAMPPATLIHELAQVLAAGAQFNLASFHGGTNLAFSGGRAPGSLDQYFCTSADGGCPLGEPGAIRPSYYAIRKVCTFASQFARVFAGLAPAPTSAVLAVSPQKSGRRLARPGYSVIHLGGSQGDVIFVFADDRGKAESTTILLPNGRAIPVHFGNQPVAWCLLNTHIGGRAKLDWTNLNAFAGNGKNLIVLYGPAGSRGLLSINFSVIEVEVPTTQTPAIEFHEEMVIVVCNEEAIDLTWLRGDTVYVGIEGFDEQGLPIPAGAWKSHFVIRGSGDHEEIATQPPPRRSPRATMSEWTSAGLEDHILGTAPRFATIDGPSTQEMCAAGSGYGLIRIVSQAWPKRKTKIIAPGAGDRIHLYVKGQLKAILGFGPGASGVVADIVPPSGRNGTLVALIDNLGRYSGGNDMHEGKGLVQHLHEVKIKRVGEPRVVPTPPRRPFEHRSYIEGLHNGDVTTGQDVQWTFEHRARQPLIVEIAQARTPALILLNDQCIGFYAGHTGRPLVHLVLDEAGGLRKGRNTFQLAPLLAGGEAELQQAVRFYESRGVLTDKAVWSFAKWEQPRLNLFKPHDKARAKACAGKPVWYRTTFTCSEAPRSLWIEPNGLSKGQIYLNGRNVGRYFVATHNGTPVPPQRRYYLPDSWVLHDQPNELVLFEEHGRDPSRVKLVYDDSAF